MSAERRLQDLLAGWCAYLDKCYESTDTSDTTPKGVYEHECEVVYDLYQKTASVKGLTPDEIGIFLGSICRLVETGEL